jgi:integrase
MQEAFWNGLFDTRWEGAPLGQEAVRLVLWLRGRGYSDKSRRAYAHAVVHLGRVLSGTHDEVTPKILDESLVENFIDRHLPVCCCYHKRPGRRANWARPGLALLLAMLREEGAIPHRASTKPVYQKLLDGYCLFLRHDRGLAETTVTTYRHYVRDFLVTRAGAITPLELAQLTADDLLAFSRKRGVGLGVTAWNHLSLSLSSFWRWLDLLGHGTHHLVGAVPLRRKYRLADVPCALSWDQVKRLLTVVDRYEHNGRRNYAMLLLAATYGLRGCEIQALRLESIGWSEDEITIFAPKTGRTRKLPLTRPVGEAILDYLREERPRSRHRQVFLTTTVARSKTY